MTKSQPKQTLKPLLPCPFCGSILDSNDSDTVYPATRDKMVWQVICKNECSAIMLGDTPEQAVDNWNKRIIVSDNNSVEVSTIYQLHQQIREINAIPLGKLIIQEQGKTVKVPKRLRKDWGYIGLNNTDFITSGFYKTGFIEVKDV